MEVKLHSGKLFTDKLVTKVKYCRLIAYIKMSRMFTEV